MRTDKEKALKLRLGGKSYTEIRKTLGVPKSTLSGWFSGLVLSEKSRTAIMQKARKKSTEALILRNIKQTTLAIIRAAGIRKEAAGKIRNIPKDELLFLGIALYWAEGYKRPIVFKGREVTHHPVSLTNSDPHLIKAFLKFLREYCEVPNYRIKASIRIFEHHNEQTLLAYWQKVTDIPSANFKKTYYGISKSSMGKRPFNKLPHGTIQIVVADTNLFHKIMGYIEGIKKLV